MESMIRIGHNVSISKEELEERTTALVRILNSNGSDDAKRHAIEVLGRSMTPPEISGTHLSNMSLIGDKHDHQNTQYHEPEDDQDCDDGYPFESSDEEQRDHLRRESQKFRDEMDD